MTSQPALQRIHRVFLMAALAVASHAPCAESDLTYRLVYLPQNLLMDENVGTVLTLLNRAQAVGYNGIVLNDTKLSNLDLLAGNAAKYKEHLAAIKTRASRLGIHIYTGLTNPGSANPMLAHDANLAEGILARDVLYRVHQGTATLCAEKGIDLNNGGFDQGVRNKLDGFTSQEGIGTATFIDPAIRRNHLGSLRMENFEGQNKSFGMVRVTQKVRVRPWHQYRLKVYVRTQDMDRPEAIQILVKSPEGRELAWARVHAKSSQDWELVQTVFPTLNIDQVTLYFGVWGGRLGKAWWTDASLEDAGLVNLIRRPSCPISVEGEAGQTYMEGKDFAPFTDPALGNQPSAGAYRNDHASPVLHLIKGSRIQENEPLLITGFVVKVVGDNQVAASIGDEKFFQLYEGEIASQIQWIKPDGFLMGHDEIRVINQDPSGNNLHLNAGELLARNIARCARIIKRESPSTPIFVWSDMFNPTQNAHNDYYLANGDLSGSWKGLPGDAIIFNWDSENIENSTTFFSNLGLRQILAGYYDGDPASISTWLRKSKNNRGVIGVMYTTWKNQFQDLEKFAQAAWGH